MDKIDAELLFTSKMGYTKRVKACLDKGANASIKNQEGVTPLMWAALDYNIDNVKLLLDAGADINAMDCDGWTAAMYAMGHDTNTIVDLIRSHGTQ